jgi:creatinine amidohydrolase
VDTDLVNAVVARTLPLLEPAQDVLFLPTLGITKSDEHASFPGTLWLSAETLLATLKDIISGVAAAGVSRFVFLNAHGGNTAVLEVAARAGRLDHGLIVAHTSWFSFADMSGFDPQTLSYDLHAGDTETSAMLAVKPERVDMSKAQDFRTSMQDWEAAEHRTGLTGQAARPGWIIEDLNAQGACGNAANASRDKGETLLNSAAAGFAGWLKDFAEFELPGRAK